MSSDQYKTHWPQPFFYHQSPQPFPAFRTFVLPSNNDRKFADLRLLVQWIDLLPPGLLGRPSSGSLPRRGADWRWRSGTVMATDIRLAVAPDCVEGPGVGVVLVVAVAAVLC